jgi:subtilisin family serine protease
MVKFLALQTPPKVGGVPVGPDQLLKDAIAYIRNTAAALGKPVAINYSIGSNLGPHDGFTDDEDFLTETFKASSGTVFVSAAGNSGGTRRHHARIDFPVGGGSVDVPMELFDPRTNRRIFDTCDWKNGTNRLFIQLYYPDGPTAITVSIDIPKDGAGFVAGPAFGAAPVTGSVKNRDWTMTHSNDNNTLRGGTTIQRRLFEFEIEPFRNRHVLGQYMLRVSSPAALTVHIWGQQARGYGFRVDTAPPVPANVFVVPESTIGSDGGAANILTVAAYNAEVTPALPITDFSSRGPLVSYGGGPAQPSKPDIAAPGEKIDAAKSRDEKPPRPGNTTQKKGTSMAAPHVTGAAALLLGMKPALTTKEVIDTIRNFARTVPPATVDEAGSGRLDAKNSFDNIP